MNESPDAYTILGVATTDSDEVIHTAYLRAVRRAHPDVTASLEPDERKASESMTKQLNVAYGLIGTAAARRVYQYDSGVGPTTGGRLRATILGPLRGRRGRPARRGEAHLAAARDLLVETRLGQWALVLVTFWLGAQVAGPSGGGTSLLIQFGPPILLAMRLGRGGPPTPILDAVAISARLSAPIVAPLSAARDAGLLALMRALRRLTS